MVAEGHDEEEKNQCPNHRPPTKGQIQKHALQRLVASVVLSFDQDSHRSASRCELSTQ